MKIKTKYDDLTYKIIGVAMDVHSRLGPGLKEKAYQKAMEESLKRKAQTLQKKTLDLGQDKIRCKE